MNFQDHIIVIGRQFGCGAREAGKILSQRLGIPYYDKEIISEAASRLGFDKELFAKADEKRPSFLRFFAGSSAGAPLFSGSGLTSEKIYEFQSMIIARIIKEGACVIVGRTADYIARDDERLVSVFLHASEEARANHIMNRGDADTIEKSIEMGRKRDKERESYYNYFTGRHWGHASNYHLTLDASTLSGEDIADMILAFIEKKDTKEHR